MYAYILLKMFTASCLYRIAYFELEEFESAKASFQRAVEVRQLRDNSADMTKYLRYIRKCDVEIQCGNAVMKIWRLCIYVCMYVWKLYESVI
jgi:hypothetical protein